MGADAAGQQREPLFHVAWPPAPLGHAHDVPEDDQERAAWAAAWEATDAEWGMPDPPPTHTQPIDISWAAMVHAVGEDEIRRSGDTQPCPLCIGAGCVRFYEAYAVGRPTTDYTTQCPACEGLGYLPTKGGIRRLEQTQGARAKAMQVDLREAQLSLRVLEQLVLDPDWDPGPTHVYHRDPSGELVVPRDVHSRRVDAKKYVRTRVDNDRATAARIIPEVQETITSCEYELSMLAMAARELEQLHALVHKAHATRKWLQQCSDAVLAHVAALQAADQSQLQAAPAAPKCSECGRAGTVQLPDGTWLCKRHGYEAGAIEHTAEKMRAVVQPLCDFCGARPGTRQFEDYYYCGPCAEDADLPAEAA